MRRERVYISSEMFREPARCRAYEWLSACYIGTLCACSLCRPPLMDVIGFLEVPIHVRRDVSYRTGARVKSAIMMLR